MELASGWVLVCTVHSAIIHFLYSDSNMLDVLKSKCRRNGSRQNGSRRNDTKNSVDKMGVNEMGVNLISHTALTHYILPTIPYPLYLTHTQIPEFMTLKMEGSYLPPCTVIQSRTACCPSSGKQRWSSSLLSQDGLLLFLSFDDSEKQEISRGEH